MYNATKNMKKKIEINVTTKPIMTPNFITIDNPDGDEVLPIEKFTDAELLILGNEFTENLIKKARSKRK